MSLRDAQPLQTILDAALKAVAPENALDRHLQRDGMRMIVGGREYDLHDRRLILLGAGKGVAPMAAAAEARLGDRISAGYIIVKDGHGLPLQHVVQSEASHPVPDSRGVTATRALLRLAQDASADDLLLCLFTGGASALTPAPAAGLTLDDLQATTGLLLDCGAPIQDMNAVRKHLSAFSGGRLAAATKAQVIALMVSDVVGNDPAVIASGPTVPDPSSFADCLAIVDHFDLRSRLPKAVLNHLEQGAAGQIADTPKPGDPLFERVQNLLIADNRQALAAAADKAADLGYQPRVITDSLSGDSHACVRDLVAQARQARAALRPGDAPLCLLAGGETTLIRRGQGLGGRNQEMAMVAAQELAGDDGITALFADTDGTDGPTDAAGGFASGSTLADAAALGLDAQAFLDNNDSYRFLDACGHLLRTGPTRTNVTGLVILLVYPPKT